MARLPLLVKGSFTTSITPMNREEPVLEIRYHVSTIYLWILSGYRALMFHTHHSLFLLFFFLFFFLEMGLPKRSVGMSDRTALPVLAKFLQNGSNNRIHKRNSEGIQPMKGKAAGTIASTVHHMRLDSYVRQLKDAIVLIVLP